MRAEAFLAISHVETARKEKLANDRQGMTRGERGAFTKGAEPASNQCHISSSSDYRIKNPLFTPGILVKGELQHISRVLYSLLGYVLHPWSENYWNSHPPEVAL